MERLVTSIASLIQQEDWMAIAESQFSQLIKEHPEIVDIATHESGQIDRRELELLPSSDRRCFVDTRDAEIASLCRVSQQALVMERTIFGFLFRF
jgi:hypothetical protein